MRKNVFIIITILLLCIPFILIKTLFPLFRFGMFAEPIKAKQKEKLLVKYQLLDNSWVTFKGTEFGLSESGYQALIRKHYYTNKADELLQKTHQTVPFKAIKWELWQFQQLDSTRVVSWTP